MGENIFEGITAFFDELFGIKQSPQGPLTVTIKPSSTQSAPLNIKQNQTYIFTANVSNGSGNYDYYWYLNNNLVKRNSPPNDVNYIFEDINGPGNYTVQCDVTDNKTGNTATSNITYITVHAITSKMIVTVSPSGSVTIPYGQSQTFTAGVSGSIGPYTYQWVYNGNNIGPNSSNNSITLSNSGNYTGNGNLYVIVTDSNGNTANSNSVAVSMPAQSTNNSSTLSVAIMPASTQSTPIRINQNQSLIFTTKVYNGSGNYMYQWYLNGNLINNTNNYYTFNGSNGTGNYTLQCDITDNSTNKTASSNIVYITVYYESGGGGGTGGPKRAYLKRHRRNQA
jgi:hypothetical protein